MRRPFIYFLLLSLLALLMATFDSGRILAQACKPNLKRIPHFAFPHSMGLRGAYDSTARVLDVEIRSDGLNLSGYNGHLVSLENGDLLLIQEVLGDVATAYSGTEPRPRLGRGKKDKPESENPFFKRKPRWAVGAAHLRANGNNRWQGPSASGDIITFTHLDAMTYSISHWSFSRQVIISSNYLNITPLVRPTLSLQSKLDARFRDKRVAVFVFRLSEPMSIQERLNLNPLHLVSIPETVAEPHSHLIVISPIGGRESLAFYANHRESPAGSDFFSAGDLIRLKLEKTEDGEVQAELHLPNADDGELSIPDELNIVVGP